MHRFSEAVLAVCFALLALPARATTLKVGARRLKGPAHTPTHHWAASSSSSLQTALAVGECTHKASGSGNEFKPCYRNPEVWGPPTWFFLHSMTLALPDEVPPEQQRAVKDLMEDMTKILPCPNCGVHLSEHMRQHPIDPHLGSQEKMVQWMIDIHNMVSADNKKRKWTKDEVLKQYDAAYLDEEGGTSKVKYRAVLDHSGSVRICTQNMGISIVMIWAMLRGV